MCCFIFHISWLVGVTTLAICSSMTLMQTPIKLVMERWSLFRVAKQRYLHCYSLFHQHHLFIHPPFLKSYPTTGLLWCVCVCVCVCCVNLCAYVCVQLGGVVKPNPHVCLMNDTYGLQDVDYQAYGLYVRAKQHRTIPFNDHKGWWRKWPKKHNKSPRQLINLPKQLINHPE